MSSSRACGFSIPSGTHFLFSGRDSSFSTSVLSPLSSNSVRWVHLLRGSDAGESKGVCGKSKEAEPGLQLSSESTDKTALRSWPLRLSGEQGMPSWARSSLTWVSHESSFTSWLRESEEGLPVFTLVSMSEGTTLETQDILVYKRLKTPIFVNVFHLFAMTLTPDGVFVAHRESAQLKNQDFPWTVKLTKWNLSLILSIYFTYKSDTDPIDNIWKRREHSK